MNFSGKLMFSTIDGIIPAVSYTHLDVYKRQTLHSALGLGTGEEVGDGERVRFVDADLIIVDARYNCTGNADAYREICEALGRYTPRPRVNDCIGVRCV